ncbi:MAG: hypothetical protein K8R91_02615 [Phycisphaerae bacterium]|nr:hypothetical protein [Phycisphaerae bacterium]
MTLIGTPGSGTGWPIGYELRLWRFFAASVAGSQDAVDCGEVGAGGGFDYVDAQTPCTECPPAEAETNLWFGAMPTRA